MDGEFDELGALSPVGAGKMEALPEAQQRYGDNFLFSARRWPQGAINPDEYDVFVNSVGQPGQGFPNMTHWCTNLPAGGGQVPAGQSWAISKVGVVSAPGNRYDDVINFAMVGTLYINKQGNVRNMGQVCFWPGGSGLTGIGVADTNPLTTFVPAVSNGVPAAGAMQELDTPILLAEMEVVKFGFRINNHAAWTVVGNQFIATCVLYGQFNETIPT
ncbi:MAG: hypothetical protein K0U84_14155 [Actinomycetia bacterium]|nr:hypothetical protein [Actinomycetes bacterium]